MNNEIKIFEHEQCPLEDTGKNSVSPCMMPNIIACKMLISKTPCFFIKYIPKNPLKAQKNSALRAL